MKTSVDQQCVEEMHLPMDGTYLNVIRFGNGPRVLLLLSGISLCGLEGAGPSVAAAYTDYAEEYTVYLFDRKKILPKGYRVEDMAEDVYHAIILLGIEHADVYGVSQGGMIAQCLAIAHPEIVHRMVLCSTQARAGTTMKQVAAHWYKLALQHDVRGLNRSFTELVYSESFQKKFKDAFTAMENNGNIEDCERFAVLVHACEVFDVYEKLSSIQCPTLVIADINDHVIDCTSGLELAQAINAEWFPYKDFSHAVFDESPDIKQKVLSFIHFD